MQGSRNKGFDMASQQKLNRNRFSRTLFSGALGPARTASAAIVHLSDMDTAISLQHDIPTVEGHGLGPVLSMSQLARHLGVTVQTLYDLRSQGRGPVGFRVGRELRFRLSEVEAWLLRLEAADAERHPEDPR